ncbi:MAG: thiamine phosphate synthase [Alphaproteobacteria bacterium]|nr:thiamine phosphate synthase [Alphaproteobacteria bacterium]
MNSFDLSIYFVADPACCGGRSVVDVVMEAAQAGVTMVQYRDKSGDMPRILANAAMMAELLKAYNIPLLINDYVDVAVAASADGVHLGQGDSDPKEARATLGFDAIIGQTAFTPEHIAAVDETVVDYIGVGPFYPTQTDKGKPVLGAERFSMLAAMAKVPVVGIGGITAENARSVVDAGANGVAMMRSISEADDISAAVGAFRAMLDMPLNKELKA